MAGFCVGSGALVAHPHELQHQHWAALQDACAIQLHNPAVKVQHLQQLQLLCMQQCILSTLVLHNACHLRLDVARIPALDTSSSTLCGILLGQGKPSSRLRHWVLRSQEKTSCSS